MAAIRRKIWPHPILSCKISKQCGDTRRVEIGFDGRRGVQLKVA